MQLSRRTRGFSPTLENVVVLWAMQLIDALLPNHVHKIFGHQLKDNTRLVDLQQQIFDRIPELLQDIEVTDTIDFCEYFEQQVW